ncbi:hypothetical protein C8R46DRAFT_1346431 [Mycena filopes]|nr:hypothetical protein C8R46DRAFT_1346431 [Mycena filopes]
MASSSSASRSARSSSGSASASPTSSFSEPQTFSSTPVSTPIAASGTPFPGGGGGGQGGGGQGGSGGDGGGSGIQSSAQLYLYTFLATLILLLGVSSAIVVRSLLLRRRHRRMVEEAIANGTWVPPAPRLRIDPRKKPRIWDAFLAPPAVPATTATTAFLRTNTSEPLRGGLGVEWEGIMPFAASYTPSAKSTPAPTAAAPSTLAPPSASAATSRTGSRVNLSLGTGAPSSTSNLQSSAVVVEGEEEKLVQPRVSVAMLIAMPAPGMFAPHVPGARAGAEAGEPQAPTWARHLPPTDDPDEMGLPHLEVGVVSVGVVSSAEEGRASEEEGEGQK